MWLAVRRSLGLRSRATTLAVPEFRDRLRTAVPPLDDHGMCAAADLPAAIAPMLASPGPVPAGPGWAAEFKHGIRAGFTSAGERWRVRSRAGIDLSDSFPELAVLPKLLGGRRIALDGELVALDTTGTSNFSRLQRRIGVQQPGPALLRSAPVTFYVFDLLVIDRQTVMAAPYSERRAMLEDLGLRGTGVDTPPSFVDAAAEVYAAARTHGLEGIVCKRLTAPYMPGRRSKYWTKTVSVGAPPVSDRSSAAQVDIALVLSSATRVAEGSSGQRTTVSNIHRD